MARSEVLKWRLRKQRVYDLTREIVGIAGMEGAVFDEVVDVWVALLLGKMSVREAERRLSEIKEGLWVVGCRE